MMPPLSDDPTPFVPDDYALTVMGSLSASCAFRALYYSLQGKPEDERTQIIDTIIGSWRYVWEDKFQRDIELYNKLLTDGRVQGSIDKLAAPEELQQRFDRTLQRAEESARKALEG